MANDRLNWALWLAQLGFPVFLIKENTKHPRSEWRLQATTDPETITALWSLYPLDNIGCACGLGLSAVDLDVKPEIDGRAGWEALCAAQGWAPYDTMMVQTPSGGLHLIYLDPHGVFPNTVGKLAPGVDTRGLGGYIVGAGSAIDGRPYELLRDNPQRMR
jgi:bifunctional DNA primase/polymerase-like protein